MSIGSLPGVKQPGCGVDHPPPSIAEVKERVELYLYSPSGTSWILQAVRTQCVATTSWLSVFNNTNVCQITFVPLRARMVLPLQDTLAEEEQEFRQK